MVDVSMQVMVGIADIKIGRAPLTIRTVLGSCIAICLYSPSGKLGGMLHFVMAYAPPEKDLVKPARYGDTGLEEFLRQLRVDHNVGTRDLVAKIFGGANVIKGLSHHIGNDNITAAEQLLKSHGIRIIGGRTGGDKGYRIELDVSTGKVSCQIFGEPAQYY